MPVIDIRPPWTAHEVDGHDRWMIRAASGADVLTQPVPKAVADELVQVVERMGHGIMRGPEGLGRSIARHLRT